jgi:hypothetical protein
MTNVFRTATKYAPELQALNTQHFTEFLARTGPGYTAMFPSNYLFSGLGNKLMGYPGRDGSIWSILDDIYGDSPQFQSAKAFNH